MAKNNANINNAETPPKIVSFIAKSGTGKTTLIEKIIKILAERGYKVSSLKHTDHDFDADIPGKDSWRHKNAGAYSTMLLSEKKMVFFSDIETPRGIKDIILKFFGGSDIVIIEGFKDLSIPKIELLRKEISPDTNIKYKNNPNLILVCGDDFIEDLKVPQININDAEKIADFIEKEIIGV
ncbi:MAG: molybdopterin-guanine dinucleotide biosynthesis protein B [Deltaproteobacteria bacterium]|nr:molybdopterin-guanine dinucleotide biosynthesis protein B [Deltaproteobacteria bacterium]